MVDRDPSPGRAGPMFTWTPSARWDEQRADQEAKQRRCHRARPVATDNAGARRARAYTLTSTRGPTARQRVTRGPGRAPPQNQRTQPGVASSRSVHAKVAEPLHSGKASTNGGPRRNVQAEGRPAEEQWPPPPCRRRLPRRREGRPVNAAGPIKRSGAANLRGGGRRRWCPGAKRSQQEGSVTAERRHSLQWPSGMTDRAQRGEPTARTRRRDVLGERRRRDGAQGQRLSATSTSGRAVEGLPGRAYRRRG